MILQRNPGNSKEKLDAFEFAEFEVIKIVSKKVMGLRGKLNTYANLTSHLNIGFLLLDCIDTNFVLPYFR